MIENSPRIVGHYRGAEAGPLVILLGGVHGNEPAGVAACERLFELLAEEPLINPGFTFSGEIIALRGNLGALATGQRFIDVDLNRIWFDAPPRVRDEFPTAEARELDGLLAVIETAIREAPLSEVVLLDIHTTTADGGVFAVTADDLPSLNLAVELGVPVVRGLLDGIAGTTLHYFGKPGHFPTEQSVRALSFEAGSHDDPASVPRALAASVNLLRALGCVQEADVSTHHDETLRQSTGNKPLLTKLSYVHKLAPGGADEFRMEPGFANFSPVRKGQLLATDRAGSIRAPAAGYLLMPLYQELGDEGFFIVQNCQSPAAF